MTIPFPEEEQRLRALKEMKLLHRPEEERFRRITRLARRHFKVAACTITLIGRDKASSLAPLGLPTEDYPRNESVCNNVVESNDPLIITDLSKHRLHHQYRNLISKLNLLFYAGVPLCSPEGWPLGALCVLDHVPRRFADSDLEALADFGAIVEDEMVIRRADDLRHALVSQVEHLRMRAFVDPLTGVWNRGALFDLLSREIERASRSKTPLAVTMLDLDHFKRINDTYGHQAGDQVLVDLCGRLKDAIRAYDGLGRYGGEEFVVVFPDTDEEMARKQAERLRKAVGDKPFETDRMKETITVSLGVTNHKAGDTVDDVLARADEALYEAKANGRDRVIIR